MSKFTEDTEERSSYRPPQKKSYQDLVQEHAQHWIEVGQIREEKFRDMQAQIQQMPDEQMRPDPRVPWSHDGIRCAGCGQDQFLVSRWVTVNGVRHRFLGKCTACHLEDVYDWGLNAWLPR